MTSRNFGLHQCVAARNGAVKLYHRALEFFRHSFNHVDHPLADVRRMIGDALEVQRDEYQIAAAVDGSRIVSHKTNQFLKNSSV